MKKTFLPAACVAGLLAFAAFMETPGTDRDSKAGSLQVSLDPSAGQKEQKVMNLPFMESRLVDTSEDHGYLVEKYEEYEIYTDLNGTVVKEEPTGKFEYLRYKE